MYVCSLRALLGVGRLRNEVVYVLSGRYPLQLYVCKLLWRYGDSLASGDRFVCRVARWAWGLDDEHVSRRLSVSFIASLCIAFPTIESMYAAARS